MILDDLADLLSSGGIGTVGATIFKGGSVESTQMIISILETGGLPSTKAFSTGPSIHAVERYRVQVLVHGPSRDYASARSKAESVRLLLDGLQERTINSRTYLYAEAVQPPFHIGEDGNDRPVISCNYDVVRTSSA